MSPLIRPYRFASYSDLGRHTGRMAPFPCLELGYAGAFKELIREVTGMFTSVNDQPSFLVVKNIYIRISLTMTIGMRVMNGMTLIFSCFIFQYRFLTVPRLQTVCGDRFAK